MAENQPSKADVTAIFKRLRSLPSNKVCFDCGAKNPTWASVTYGVFICFDCSAVHRSLGVHISFVRSTQLDTNWSWLQIRAMQVGGNVNAHSFFQQHNCSTSDTQQKYNSRAAQLYREKLHHLAAAAMRMHGTKVHIDSTHGDTPPSPEVQEVDFFEEHVEASLRKSPSGGSLDASTNLSSPTIPIKTSLESDVHISPNLSSQVGGGQKQEPRKPTIGGRKPASARKGLGAKKGLGAQKVSSADFSQIEKEAKQADQLRESVPTPIQSTNKPTPEEEQDQMRSVRLAYQDLTLKEKELKTKMQQVDPKKAQQLERLGMGATNAKFLSSGGVSHSALSDMKTIQQDAPSSAKSRDRDRDMDDDFEFFGSFTSGPPKYRDSPFGSRRSDDSLGDDDVDKPKKSSSSLMSETTILPLETEGSSRTRRPVISPSSESLGTEAQKKFGNAKAISSDQYFGGSRDFEMEHRANLSRFQGSSGISSEDFFGHQGAQKQSPSYNAPNLYDIREGVRDGVTKVAGRLSSLASMANGVMTSLQEKYGY